MNKLLIACAVVILVGACSYSGSFKRGPNPLESLYDEILDKDPETKKLEGLIQTLDDGRVDSLGAFSTYERKNTSYYEAANAHADRISDPALRNKVKDMIAVSLTNYENSVARHKAALKDIDASAIKLQDLHLALKVIKTLPAMHQYQAENLPSTMPIEHYLRQQNEAVKMAETMVKK